MNLLLWLALSAAAQNFDGAAAPPVAGPAPRPEAPAPMTTPWALPTAPGTERPNVPAWAWEPIARVLRKAGEPAYPAVKAWDAEGLDFSGIFLKLCGNARAEKGRRDAALTRMFGALLLWTERGGRPKLQGREDWPLHIIYGGGIAAVYGRVAAELAAYEKETLDAYTPGNAFDLDDLAITYFAARWVAGARRDVFLASWADGTRTLGALPKLSFGMLPPRTLPPAARERASSRWADDALR